MSGISRIRILLLTEGVSFYELEEKPSRREFFESPAKSMARSFMFREGISVQDLKKGTIYEVLEKQGKKKEDIEKHVKDMAAMEEKMYYGDTRSDFAYNQNKRMVEERVKEIAMKKKDKGKEGVEYTPSEEALKDMEMCCDLDAYFGMTKKQRKAAKIEKKKKMRNEKKLAVARRNSPQMP